MEKTKGLEFDVEGFSIIELEERQEMSAALNNLLNYRIIH